MTQIVRTRIYRGAVSGSRWRMRRGPAAPPGRVRSRDTSVAARVGGRLPPGPPLRHPARHTPPPTAAAGAVKYAKEIGCGLNKLIFIIFLYILYNFKWWDEQTVRLIERNVYKRKRLYIWLLHHCRMYENAAKCAGMIDSVIDNAYDSALVVCVST